MSDFYIPPIKLQMLNYVTLLILKSLSTSMSLATSQAIFQIYFWTENGLIQHSYDQLQLLYLPTSIHNFITN